MIIESKETIIFNEKEHEAFDLVMRVSSELVKNTKNPSLYKLATEVYDKVAKMWGYEEDILQPFKVTLTDEIHAIITNCPKLEDEKNNCKQNCPLWQACQDYWNGNTIE